MDEAVRAYFDIGLSYQEILSCLERINGIQISMRTLKRVLNRLRLFRRQNFSDILEVALYIMDNVRQSGKQLGYKMMHLKCLQHGYVVTQESVRLLLNICDKEGVELRRRNRLQRRNYTNLGPNFLWHIDGYDKLKPYGLCINGCIDGFSRFIHSFEVNRTNSDPKVIGGYFMTAVKKLQGCPLRVRTDLGTENGHVKQMLLFMREGGNDQYANNCFLTGSSNHNQRIEQWWGILRKENVQYWMDFFEMLKGTGVFTGTFLDKALIQFCFMDLLQVFMTLVSQLSFSPSIIRTSHLF